MTSSLQIASGITKFNWLQSASGITKCDRLLLQNVLGIKKCDNCYKVRRNITNLAIDEKNILCNSLILHYQHFETKESKKSALE